VNNAGVYPNILVMNMETDDFARVLNVNLLGVFLCTRFVAKHMIERNHGRIINISSIDALHPSSAGLAHYDASKHGVWGFTKNIAFELAPHRIWVNANRGGMRQAAQVLRTHVTSLGAHHHLAQVSTVASLVYADRLNQPPIYPGDPNMVEDVSARFGEILGDHLDLAAIILSGAGGMLNISPVRLLDEIVVTRLGSYS
jgi:NAD(P)-dependent dehydrogenase (short-subunit alcohol dehydrogenase family)